MNVPKIAVIGLGYVGLPLARLFATRYPVIGYDKKHSRIEALRKGEDTTLEVDSVLLHEVLINKNPTSTEEKGLFCTSDPDELASCNYFIVTVPTPVDIHHRPLLTPLYSASEIVGKYLKKGAIVIYESTVYPGCTEEECVPILEKASGLTFNKDFFVGYSPERINPGDKVHTVEHILKITSGSTIETAQKVNALYQSIIEAGTHLAPTIKVAEAAKVIENSQRDINIAFVNELAKICNILNIDVRAVLEAAGTKWNFLKFSPGLVGGHCTGVDPYYLAQKAQEVGYHPEIILAGRRMNDSMGKYVADQVIKLMIERNIPINGAHILVLGITFKENCPDVRNTKVTDVVRQLESFHTQVTVYDPWANPEDVWEEHQIHSHPSLPIEEYDAIVLAVAHREFLSIPWKKIRKTHSVIYDVKGILPDADKYL
ncbi:nucleotide sugar dehydrogenase [Capnocytophaga sp. G2]|uniref:nucleotide sugar dehydrogenase n=1 Tax=Capnocytophaga sp. G2 TaxID=3110695 RepID=UPI002B465616|nr:nucleotide sugar dehydrogenase [Capnocytophaga sp. G2]MEB3004261.1 nucleotide sugar dehydrogenase [Capnocytophaga sp. G2]